MSEAKEPVVLLVELFKGVGNYTHTRSLASMDEPLVLKNSDVEFDVGNNRGFRSNVPRTRHELWRTPGPLWEECKREDSKTWTFCKSSDFRPVDCARTYFWKH
jgi:hypothetical protein